MSYQNILLEQENGLAVLTLNRPEVRNALDLQTWQEIRAAINELKYDATVKVVIITGAGGKAFAGGRGNGGDLLGMLYITQREWV